MLAITSVVPSRGDFTACNVPVLVLAPGRLSVTNVWPRRLVRPSATSRASKSVPPPAANGTSVLPPQGARHDLLAAQVLFLDQLATHRLAGKFRRCTGHAPAAREHAEFLPPF